MSVTLNKLATKKANSFISKLEKEYECQNEKRDCIVEEIYKTKIYLEKLKKAFIKLEK